MIYSDCYVTYAHQYLPTNIWKKGNPESIVIFERHESNCHRLIHIIIIFLLRCGSAIVERAYESRWLAVMATTTITTTMLLTVCPWQHPIPIQLPYLPTLRLIWSPSQCLNLYMRHLLRVSRNIKPALWQSSVTWISGCPLMLLLGKSWHLIRGSRYRVGTYDGKYWIESLVHTTL